MSVPRGVWLALFVGAFAVGACAAEPVEVTVDCAQAAGPRARPERFLNNSILHAPPLALADRMTKEYGRPEIIRCWLTLRHMWDRKTDAYTYNFKIPRRVYTDAHRADLKDGTAMTNRVMTSENFEEYLTAFSRNSGEVLLNIRNYEREVVEKNMTVEKWGEVFGNALRHYKQLCPNLRYIEVLNEYECASAMGGKPLTDEAYYDLFYRAAYEAVNRVNDELKSDKPLLVGGPCPAGYAETRLDRFIELYGKDASPRKRLDFLSFHDYGHGSAPSIYGTFAGRFREKFQRVGLPGDLPIFMTEVGYGGGGPTPDPERNRAQAAALTSYVYHARRSANLRVFPWVLFHSRNQLCFAQFTQDLTMTPFGAAVKAWSLQKDNEVSAAVKPAQTDLGVYALASSDDSGIAIQVWNYQSRPDKENPAPRPSATAQVAVRNVPEKWAKSKLRVRQYLIDSGHSNCFAADKGGGQLQLAGSVETDAKGLEKLTVALEPNAICLWLVDVH